jgi:hypothetical protein
MVAGEDRRRSLSLNSPLMWKSRDIGDGYIKIVERTTCERGDGEIGRKLCFYLPGLWHMALTAALSQISDPTSWITGEIPIT